MPLSVTAKFRGKEITVEEAIKLSKLDRQGLTCLECGQLVTPHQQSKPGKKFQSAHFEHPASDGGRNKICTRSAAYNGR